MLGIETPLLDQGAIQFMILVVMLVIVAVQSSMTGGVWKLTWSNAGHCRPYVFETRLKE